MMKRSFKGLFLFILAVLCAGLLALYPREAAGGITHGLTLAAGLFIPAMLPMYFLVFFIAETKTETVFRKILSPLCRFLRVQIGAAIVLVSGFLGGYPSGAIAAKKQVERGVLSIHEAGRLMVFCINPGPAFVIGAVGGTLFGSVKAGLLLLFAGWAASGVLSLACRAKGTAVTDNKVNTRTYSSLTAAFCDSVSNAASASLTACASIALSCAAVAVLSKVLGGGESALYALFEVTGGVSALSKTGSLPLCAAALGFGGVSVIIQIAAFSANFFGAGKLLLFRLIHALLSAGFTAALSVLFPIEKIGENAAQTFAAVRENQIPAAILLVFCGFVLSLANLLKKRYNGDGN